MKKLICIFSVIFLITAKAEDGAWVFLQQSPPDELVTGVESGSLIAPMVLNGELIFNKTYLGQSKILASDGTVLGAYTKTQDSPVVGLGAVKDNYGTINGKYIVKGRNNDLVSWDVYSEQTTTLTPPEVTSVSEIIQCDPDPLEGEQVYFTATTETHGKELWVSTGTYSGTYMIADINPGVDGSLTTLKRFGRSICDESYFLFMADDGVHGFELHSASRAGATMIRDSFPGSGDGIRGGLTKSFDGNHVYLGAVPCDADDTCNYVSPEFPYGTTNGLIRRSAGPGFGDDLKLRNPSYNMGFYREGLSPGITYTGSSGSLFVHDGFGNVYTSSYVQGNANQLLNLPSFSILRTQNDSNNNGEDGAYILTGLTETFVPGLAGINLTYSDTFTPFNNGYVFYNYASTGPDGYYYSDGTVEGSYQIVSNVTGGIRPTVYGDSVYYYYGGSSGIKRYGPAKNPEIGFMGTITVNEDGIANVNQFIIGGSVTTFADLSVTANSLDENLINDMDISFNTSNAQIRNFTFSPLTDQYGDAQIELTVEDHRGWTSSTIIPVTIRPVNDEPSFDFVSDEVRIPSNTADTFIFENSIENINFGPNETHQAVESYFVNYNSSFIDDVSIDTDGTLSITTNGNSGASANISVRMYDNGGTERGGDNVSQQKTFTVFAQDPVDVEVLGQYIGTNDGNHVFEYTVINNSTNTNLNFGDLTINSISSQMSNVVTTCISNCAESAVGSNTQFGIALNLQTLAVIQVTGEFDINANPGVFFTSSLKANVTGTQLDADTSNNEVTIEMPQIVFRDGFE